MFLQDNPTMSEAYGKTWKKSFERDGVRVEFVIREVAGVFRAYVKMASGAKLDYSEHADFVNADRKLDSLKHAFDLGQMDKAIRLMN